MIKIARSNIFFLCTLFLFLFACQSETDKELKVLIDYHQLQGQPEIDDNQIADIKSPKAQLGKLLFFSTTLSGNNDVACASCHHPFNGGDDDLSLSVGVNPLSSHLFGKDRLSAENRILVPRNAPTTFNSSLWKKRLFHDGRVERLNPLSEEQALISTPDEHYGDVDPTATSLLQAQAAFPVTSQHEMRDTYLEKNSNQRLRKALVDNLIKTVGLNQDKANWEELFREVYDDQNHAITELITFARIQELLAEYQRSQVFINSPWSKYVQGKSNALSASAKKGAVIFYQDIKKGGAGCVSCHTGDFFTDEDFHILAIPQIGEGKELSGDDKGRYLRTGVLDDRYAFRTPSLLNVAETAPYGHSGAYKSLKEIVQHHLDPEQAILNYDFSLTSLDQKHIENSNSKVLTEKALKAFKADSQNLERMKIKHLGEAEIIHLVSFLESLSDPCIKSKKCLSDWVPSNTDPNPDESIIGIAE